MAAPPVEEPVTEAKTLEADEAGVVDAEVEELEERLVEDCELVARLEDDEEDEEADELEEEDELGTDEGAPVTPPWTVSGRTFLVALAALLM